MTARTNTATRQQSQGAQAERPSEPRINLSYRYGAIGIQAVAAAARYTVARKPATYAPPVARIEQRFIEA